MTVPKTSPYSSLMTGSRAPAGRSPVTRWTFRRRSSQMGRMSVYSSLIPTEMIETPVLDSLVTVSSSGIS